MGPSAVSRGSGRRLEGESGWLEIQEACCDRCRRGASNGAEAATAEEAHGRRARKGRGPQICSRSKIAARGCRKAAQGPEQGLREPDGVPREAQPKPPGPGGTGPGLPKRHPRTRRTPGLSRRGRTARAQERANAASIESRNGAIRLTPIAPRALQPVGCKRSIAPSHGCARTGSPRGLAQVAGPSIFPAPALLNLARLV